jgi:hypothetical protein
MICFLAFGSFRVVLGGPGWPWLFWLSRLFLVF